MSFPTWPSYDEWRLRGYDPRDWDEENLEEEMESLLPLDVRFDIPQRADDSDDPTDDDISAA